MFQHILVPLDGSLRAERELIVAARLARANRSAITLVRIVPAPLDYTVSLAPATAPLQGEIATEVLTEASQYLDQLAHSALLEGIPVEQQALFGSVAPTILSVAQSSGCDLIIIASHGYTGMMRWALGSVAEKIARHAPMPVLILRESGPMPSGPHPDATQPLRVLVPLDGSTLAKAALEPAAELIAALAAPTRARLHLVRVVASPATAVTDKEQEEREQRVQQTKAYLAATAQHIREGFVAPVIKKLGLPVSWSVTVDTDVAGAIIRAAENGEDTGGAGVFGTCDLIAIATHGRGGIQRWVLGSVTERVLHTTKLPVLIVRPTEAVQETMERIHTVVAVQ
jgi:nucleotide-binding universal stress UspA family protein